MRLDVRLTHTCLDQLSSQAVVAFVFEGDLFFTESFCRFNDKLGSSLTTLLHNRFFTGRLDEVLLVDPGRLIGAQKLLLVGLGRVAEYPGQALRSGIYKALSALEGLRLREFGLAVPWIIGQESGYAELIMAGASVLAHYYGVSKKYPADFLVTVIFSIEQRLIMDLDPLREELIKCIDPLIDGSVAIMGAKVNK